MHLTEGEIRAYQDHELNQDLRRQVEAHLDSCPQCQEQASVLLARARNVNERLAILSAKPVKAPLTVGAARAHFQARLNPSKKERETMLNKIFSRVSRPAWAGLAILALLLGSLAFSPVRAIANNFLGLFRVQQFTVIQVNPGDLPNQLGSSSQLEYMLSQDVKFEYSGELQKVANAAEASAKAGIPVRLPTAIQGEQTLQVQSGGSAVFNVDLKHVQALLNEIGRSDIKLPVELDGATVTVDIPAGVVAQYGDCTYQPEAAQEAGYDPDDKETPRLPNCTTLTQMPSPTISAPPGLDIPKIGEAFLQLMGMSAEEAAHFSQNVDWATTLVVPIPRYSTTYKNAIVDGVPATLIEQANEDRPDAYLLIWVKDGILYALTGPGDASTALRIAGSLSKAQ